MGQRSCYCPRRSIVAGLESLEVSLRDRSCRPKDMLHTSVKSLSAVTRAEYWNAAKEDINVNRISDHVSVGTIERSAEADLLSQNGSSSDQTYSRHG